MPGAAKNWLFSSLAVDQTTTNVTTITTTTRCHLCPTWKRIGSPGLLPSSPARSCCCFRARFWIIFSKIYLVTFSHFACWNGVPNQSCDLIQENSLEPNNTSNGQLMIFCKHIVCKVRGTALDSLQNTQNMVDKRKQGDNSHQMIDISPGKLELSLIARYERQTKIKKRIDMND